MTPSVGSPLATALAFTCLVMIVGGCASALRPIAESDLAVIDPGRADALAAARLAAEARRLFAQRPDIESVRSAEKLWLRAALADSTSAAGIVGLVETRIWLARHLPTPDLRTAKATETVGTAQLCAVREPENPHCAYWLALAVGVQAEQRRTTALDGLKVMIELLSQAIEGAEELEYAGPRRVLALVLVRAPGWPSGPGDPDAGLVHALRAVELFPEYPPNQLALAAAYAEIEDPLSSSAHYRLGLDAALAWRRRGHPDAWEWVEEAEDGVADAVP